MTFGDGAITTIEDMVFPIEVAITSIGPTQGDGLGNQRKVVVCDHRNDLCHPIDFGILHVYFLVIVIYHTN
jgi:hypothetical protein